MLKQPRSSTTKRVFGSLLVTALVGGGGCLAWASQPKQTQVVDSIPEGQIRLDLDVLMNGVKGRTVTLFAANGEHFSFNGHSDGRQWAIEGVATDQRDGTVHLDLDIYRDGLLATSPELVVKNGDVGRLAIGHEEPAVKSLPFEMNLRATTSAFNAVSDARTKHNMPSYRERVEPVYPESAHSDRREGTTVLGVMVKADGRVERTEVSKSSGHADLDLAAQQAVADWTFEPAFEDGKPVPAWVGVPVRFELGEGFYPGVNNLLEPVDVKPGTSSPISGQLPEYPKTEAGKNGGHVMLRVTVQPDGSPTDLKVVESVPAGVFDANAIAAVRTWQFEKPESGKATQVLVPVKFAPEGQ